MSATPAPRTRSRAASKRRGPNGPICRSGPGRCSATPTPRLSRHGCSRPSTSSTTCAWSPAATVPAFRELRGDPSLSITAVPSPDRDWFDLGIVVVIDGRTIPFGTLFSALSRGRTRIKLSDGAWFSLAHPSLQRLRDLLEEPPSSTNGRRARASRVDTSPCGAISRTWPTSPPPRSSGATSPARCGRWHPSRRRDAARIPRRTPAVPARGAGVARAAARAPARWHPGRRHGSREDRADPRAHRARAGGGGSGDRGSSSRRRRCCDVERGGGPLRARPADRDGRGDLGAAHADDRAARGRRRHRRGVVRRRAHGRRRVRRAGMGGRRPRRSAVREEPGDAHPPSRRRAPRRLGLRGHRNPDRERPRRPVGAAGARGTGTVPLGATVREEYVRAIERLPSDAPTELSAAAAEAHRRGSLARLRSRVRPFLLRRTKDVVAADLPPKQEQTIAVPLGPAHRELYDRVLQRERQKVLGLLDDLDRQRFIVFRSITLLRMLALAPGLIDERDALSGRRNSTSCSSVSSKWHPRVIVRWSSASSRRSSIWRRNAWMPPASPTRTSTARPPGAARSSRGSAGRRPRVPHQPQGRRLRPDAGGGRVRVPPRPLVEPRRRGAGHRPHAPHRPDEQRVRVPIIAAGTVEEKVLELQQRKAALSRAVLDDGEAFANTLDADDIRGILGG